MSISSYHHIFGVMTDAQLIGMFGQAANDPQIIDKCSHLCNLFNLSAQELFSNWEAYIFKHHNDTNTKISLENLESLQNYIQDRITLENAESSKNSLKLNNKHSTSKYRANTSNSNSFLEGNDSLAGNHQIKKRKLNFSSSPVKESQNAVGSNQILESVHAETIPDKETTVVNKNIKLIANFNPKKYKYRTMNLKLLEIADYLDEKIDSIAQIVLDKYNLEEAQFADPTRQSQSEIYTVGRIVPDSPLSSSSELNLDSLFLETSRSNGFGCRVHLDLSNISKCSFFSGQIVALRGINATGESFKVIENLKIPYLGSISYTSDEVENFAEIIGNDNLKVIVTSGPYHPKKSLDFTHFENFVNHINTVVKPDVVIMMGPFIDIQAIPEILSNSFFNSGEDIDDLKNLDDLFISFVSPILNEIKCQRVIILPHGSDVNNAHTPYPQAPFNRKTLGLPKTFKCFPNPSLFNINELSFGISTADIFKDLKDVTTKDANSNRIERIVEHVIQQRQFYPVHPPPDAPNNNFFQLDTSYLGLSEFNDEMPDILILPSVVKSFAKIVKNVLVINPGSMVRSDGSRGSYALMQVKCPNINDMDKIASSTEDEEEVTEVYLATAWKRARVDILSV